MTNIDIENIDRIVYFLNQEMYETSPPQVAQFLEENQISYNSNGDTINIEFLGVQIWNSDNDPRETLENSGEPIVPLRCFIKGKIIETINLISQIKLE